MSGWKTVLGTVVGWMAGAVASMTCGHAAWAAQGVSEQSVTLVQTADLSGSRAPLAKELIAGWRAYLAQVNERGGVHGRRVVLVSEDDRYDIEQTRRIVKERIDQDSAFAFVSLIGTANAAAALPLLNAANVPLVAPLSGAHELRSPPARNVFHIRASYAREVERMVEHVLTLGVRRVAVFYDDDAFGRDVLNAAEASLASRGLSLAARGRVERGSTDVSDAVKAVADAKPQVVICGSFGKSLSEFVKGMKRTPAAPAYYALSFFPAGASIRDLGDDARGIGVTQVMPKVTAVGIPLVREYRQSMQKYAPDEPVTAIGLEGYVTAKVTVEGLRRAGPNLTRQRFIEAMETLREFDLGSLRLTYQPGDHAGLRYTDISVVGEAGQLRH